ncbi:MAG: LuxR C-terminal-related transcriptional regulator [Duncaniella sp.]|nr:LuxR C-terminal-related transcriptional regulator [Duncaniella sp.]
MKTPVIVTLSSSPVVAEGLASVIRAASTIPGATVIETDEENAVKTVAERRADIVVGDNWILGPEMVAALRDAAEGELAVVALTWSMLPEQTASVFDATISIFDTPAKIAAVIEKCCPNPDEESRKELSPREKDVIIGVVKGLSNKEIADSLNVSTHTVMTHRRNIAAKLQIHSPAGLTIYAIVSHLVNLDEVKDTI